MAIEIDNKTGERRVSSQTTPETTLTASDLSRLEEMTREELIKLVRRFAAVYGVLLPSGDDETAQAFLDGLALFALEKLNKREYGLIKEIREAISLWMDRKVGKAKQSVELTGKDGEPLSLRLMAVQERLLRDVTPPLQVIDN